MRTFSRVMFALCCLGGIAVIGQEMTKDGAMSRAAAAKKTMMAPDTMATAKKSMMGAGSMVPAMVAKEMVRQEVMQDKDAIGMVEKNSMAKPADNKMMTHDNHVSTAGEKMAADPTAMQMLFQELVARHIASQKMAMKKQTGASMMSKAGKDMKSMMMDEGAMMGAKKEVMSSESGAMMRAREELIHALLLDKEVMALVDKESRSQQDPKMAAMMSDEHMQMAAEAMTNDKNAIKGMVQETMARQMVNGKPAMMRGEAKPKK